MVFFSVVITFQDMPILRRHCRVRENIVPMYKVEREGLHVFEELKKKRKGRRKRGKKGKRKRGGKEKKERKRLVVLKKTMKGFMGDRLGSRWLWKACLGFLLIAIGGQQSISLKAVSDIICQKDFLFFNFKHPHLNTHTNPLYFNIICLWKV